MRRASHPQTVSGGCAKFYLCGTSRTTTSETPSGVVNDRSPPPPLPPPPLEDRAKMTICADIFRTPPRKKLTFIQNVGGWKLAAAGVEEARVENRSGKRRKSWKPHLGPADKWRLICGLFSVAVDFSRTGLSSRTRKEKIRRGSSSIAFTLSKPCDPPLREFSSLKSRGAENSLPLLLLQLRDGKRRE